MELIRLLYFSEPNYGEHWRGGTIEIPAILETCTNFNSKKNITGALMYAPKYFIQALEGENDTVRELFKKIRKDKRHKNVNLVEAVHIKKRMFGKWTMAYLDEKNLPKNFWKQHLPENLKITDVSSNAWSKVLNDYLKYLNQVP